MATFPHGRELSFAWLAGTVMTGLTSVLLMGAALYVSFEGQDTFSTAYKALQINFVEPAGPVTDLLVKADRARPIARTRSDLEIIEASIMEQVDGRDMIRKQPFVRLRATLATAATSLSDDVPAYDPVAIINANQPIGADDAAALVNTDIYGAEVEGEVAVKLASLPMTFVPPRSISDQGAAEFVRLTVEGTYGEIDPAMLAYAAAPDLGVRDLGIVTGGTTADGVIAGIAENVTLLPKTSLTGVGRSERIMTLPEPSPLGDVLIKNGFSEITSRAVLDTLRNVMPLEELPAGTRLRILLGPSRAGGDIVIPYRLSIYFHDSAKDTDRHAVTVALTDKGQYVLGIAPAEMEFPDEDTEEISVSNLPSIYRAIWETGRKHDLEDATIERIIAMYAYDVDLTRKIAAGDSIEILQTAPDAEGGQELIYVGLTLGSTVKELFRFRTDDGVVDFYDPDGQTGKRFLTRRPLQGGGTLRSRFGYRIHPIFKSRKMHTGIDLSASTGTPIYASGDGVIEQAGWSSGYGKKVEIKHVNGFETAYGHMSQIADGITPGVRVRQGEVIGYVGSTGYSTGPHLHFEITINGNFVDPLSVKLPRENSLAAQYAANFAQTMDQIHDLMQRDPAPVNVAAVN